MTKRKKNNSEIIERVKLLTNENVEDELIETLIGAVENKILLRIKRFKPEENLENIDDSIFYLIIDLVVARYNRIGAEGMKSEAMANRSYSYIENYEEKKIDEVVDSLFGKEEDEKGKITHGGFLFLWDTTHL